MPGGATCLLPLAFLIAAVQALRHGGPPPESYMEGLWDGFDVDEDSEMRSMAETHHSLVTLFPGVQMLGPPDSGTNLWVKMVQLNWPGRVARDGGALDHVVWKHALDGAEEVKRLFEKKLQDLSNTTLIISVRSPISQMASWQRKPYSLSPCFIRAVSAWNKTCFSNTKALHHDITPGVSIWTEDAKSNHFSSSMDVYNQYLRQYLDLEQLGGFRNVMVTPFEDMVLSPDEVLASFANKTGWPLPENGLKIYGSSAKGEVGHGRAKALEKLRARPWLNEYKAALSMLCQGLDKEQLARFSEGSHTTSPYSYTQDCS